MFKIRAEQIRAFQPEAEAAFVRRVMDYLRENHPDEAARLPAEKTTVGELPARTLRAMVEGGLAQARKYGFEWKSNLISFVVLSFAAAPNFDKNEAVTGVLTDTSVAVEERIDRLMERMTDEDWAAVEKNYEPAAWTLPIEEAV